MELPLSKSVEKIFCRDIQPTELWVDKKRTDAPQTDKQGRVLHKHFVSVYLAGIASPLEGVVTSAHGKTPPRVGDYVSIPGLVISFFERTAGDRKVPSWSLQGETVAGVPAA